LKNKFYRVRYEDDCVRLTVDFADSFNEAVKRAQEWMRNCGLAFQETKTTDGESIRWKCLNPPAPKLAMAIYIERSYDGEDRTN